MSWRIPYIDKVAKEASSSFQNPGAIFLLIRGVYLYYILKIIFNWRASHALSEVMEYGPITSPLAYVVFLPCEVFYANPTFFLSLGLLLLGVSIWKPNYVVSGFLFWFAFSYYRLHFSVANGSDVVLLVLILLSIGLSAGLVWKKYVGLQRLIFNGTSLLIKIQIAIIYLLSGVDKLYSPAWRSGDAMHYIKSLDYLVNPRFVGLLPDVPWFNLCIGWCVIIFELLFPLLIWNRKTKFWMLSIGVLFHLAIIILLSLIDFGLIMIISYLIFLTDADWARIGVGQSKRSTPVLS